MSIFLTKAWRESWWDTWGKTKGFTLSDIGDCLLYFDSYSLHNILPVKSLNIVGTNYRRISTPRAEYLDISDHEQNGINNYQYICEKICAESWTELFASDIVADGEFHNYLKEWSAENNFYCRILNTDIAYNINVNDTFDTYLHNLGKNTRLKYFNRRKLLENKYSYRVIRPALDEFDVFIDKLNRFHKIRWGIECYSPESRRFFKLFLDRLSKEGGAAEFSEIIIDNDTVSVVFNLLWNKRLYNIQSGFLENFDKKISLGAVHLGIIIEEAFNNKSVGVLDLLGGEGKHTNYKKHIANNEIKLISLLFIKSRFYKLLYKLRDRKFVNN